MQIVIDIPEEYFRVRKSIQNGSIASKMILNSLKNGIPLPKGHGRLIDGDKLANAYDTAKNLDLYGCGGLIIEAPTIIEADKEEKDGN